MGQSFLQLEMLWPLVVILMGIGVSFDLSLQTRQTPRMSDSQVNWCDGIEVWLSRLDRHSEPPLAIGGGRQYLIFLCCSSRSSRELDRARAELISMDTETLENSRSVAYGLWFHNSHREWPCSSLPKPTLDSGLKLVVDSSRFFHEFALLGMLLGIKRYIRCGSISFLDYDSLGDLSVKVLSGHHALFPTGRTSFIQCIRKQQLREPISWAGYLEQFEPLLSLSVSLSCIKFCSNSIELRIFSDSVSSTFFPWSVVFEVRRIFYAGKPGSDCSNGKPSAFDALWLVAKIVETDPLRGPDLPGVRFWNGEFVSRCPNSDILSTLLDARATGVAKKPEPISAVPRAWWKT